MSITMFAYVGLLGLIGTKRGMNFALIASIVFGKKGYDFASGLLSTLLLGWSAVQTRNSPVRSSVRLMD